MKDLRATLPYPVGSGHAWPHGRPETSFNELLPRLPFTALFLLVVCVGGILPGADGTDSAGVPATGHRPAHSEWLCYRGNPALDGRSRGHSHITQPKIAWKRFVGAIDTLLEVKSEPGNTALVVPDNDIAKDAATLQDPRWNLSPRQAEIAGARRPVIRDACITYHDIFPEIPGLEKVEFESGFNKPTVHGKWQPCVGRCFAWKNGKWVKKWETEVIHMLFVPLPLVGDFDGDGKPEIAFLPWDDLVILDAQTGAIKDRCTFTKGRSYGFLGAYDLDRDGIAEFLVQADFCKHIDVLGFRKRRLTLLWRHEIELDFSDPRKILSVNPDPVADLDGDGRLEVLACIYNDTGDSKWHTLAYDGITGQRKADATGEYLNAAVDVDGDGRAELLTTTAPRNSIPTGGTIRIRGIRNDGTSVVRWEMEGAAWQTWDRQLPENVNSKANLPQRDVLYRRAGDTCHVVIRKDVPEHPENAELLLAAWDNGPRIVSRVRGPRLEALALDGGAHPLIRATAHPGSHAGIEIESGQATVLAATRRGTPHGAPVIARDERKSGAVVVAQGALGLDDLALFDVAHPAPETPVRHILGRGQSESWPDVSEGPVVADLAGDGGRQLIYSKTGPNGCARIVSSDLAGTEIWHHDFPEIPGTPPIWNNGGIIFWQTGHFTDRRRLDVLVQVRRSIMHTEETALLSGTDGAQIWRRDHQVSNRGVGGTLFAIADCDGDGLDDAASFHPSLVYILKGTNGRDIIAMNASWKGLPSDIVYWGLPIAGDFEGKDRTSLFFASKRPSMTGLVRSDGTLAWWNAFDEAAGGYHAIGDFNGNGRPEAIGFGYPDGARCYDAATGKIKWRMPLPRRCPFEAATADIDSDGRDEAIFVIKDTLYCAGTTDEGTGGRIKWHIQFPTEIGAPAIADVDGKGSVSIILQGSDGYVYCVQ